MPSTHTDSAHPAWRLSLQLKFALVLHAVVLLMLMVQPAQWHWALAIFVSYNLIIVAATMWPRSRLLGANLVRLPPESAARGEIALTFDDGPDPEITPAVLDMLDVHGAKATFFCIAEKALANADLCRDMIRRGHAVENHSSTHRHTFAMLGPRGYIRELCSSQQKFETAIGRRPIFFRAPAGFRNPFLWPALEQQGMTLASWTRRGFDTRETHPNRVLYRLLRNLNAGDILLLHDGHVARTKNGRPVVLEVLPPLLQAIHKAGLTPVTLQAAIRSLTAERSQPAKVSAPHPLEL